MGLHAFEDIVFPSVPDTSSRAIELLQADHRQLEEWFSRFQWTEDAGRKEALVADICQLLQVHMRLEEEIFYPAFLEATGNTAMHHEAIVEHECTRELVRKIMMSPGLAADEYFAARVSVLATMFEHHIDDEEDAGGMFDLTVWAGVDLDALGARMEHRRMELMESFEMGLGC